MNSCRFSRPPFSPGRGNEDAAKRTAAVSVQFHGVYPPPFFKEKSAVRRVQFDDDLPYSIQPLFCIFRRAAYHRLVRFFYRNDDIPAPVVFDMVYNPMETALIRRAAQGEVVHNDDTTVKILELMGERARREALA